MKNLIQKTDITTAGQAEIDEYLNYLDVNRKTKNNYFNALKSFTLFLSDNDIHQVTRQSILDYKEYLHQNKKNSTANTYLVAIKSFFNYLEKKHNTENPTADIKNFKTDKTFKKDIITPDQIKSIIHSLPANNEEDRRNKAIFILLVFTGLRTIELERANVEDLRLIGNASYVLDIQSKGSTQKNDLVKVSNYPLSVLQNYLEERGATPGEPLFVSVSDRCKNKRLSSQMISRIIKAIFKNNNLDSERLTAHSLRHTAITLAIESGAKIHEVKAMARHSNIETTMIYVHQLDRLKNSAEDQLASFLAI